MKSAIDDASDNELDSTFNEVAVKPTRKRNEWQLLAIRESHAGAMELLREEAEDDDCFGNNEFWRIRNRDDNGDDMVETFYCPIGGRPSKVANRTCHAQRRFDCSHDNQTVTSTFIPMC